MRTQDHLGSLGHKCLKKMAPKGIGPLKKGCSYDIAPARQGRLCVCRIGKIASFDKEVAMSAEPMMKDLGVWVVKGVSPAGGKVGGDIPVVLKESFKDFEAPAGQALF
jgi:hypothetical protein